MCKAFTIATLGVALAMNVSMALAQCGCAPVSYAPTYTSYYAPTTSYCATPEVTYYAPTTPYASYYAPYATYYAAPTYTSYYYSPYTSYYTPYTAYYAPGWRWRW